MDPSASVNFVQLERRQVQQLRDAVIDDDPERFAQLCRELDVGINDSVYFQLRASRRPGSVGTLDSDVAFATVSAVDAGRRHVTGPSSSSSSSSSSVAAASARIGRPKLPVCLPIHLAVLSGSQGVIEWAVRQKETLLLSIAHWSGRDVFELARELPDEVQKMLISGGSSLNGDFLSGSKYDDQDPDFLLLLQQSSVNGAPGIAGDLDAAVPPSGRPSGQRVPVAEFEKALKMRRMMRELQLGSSLHLLLYMILTIYTCSPAAPWSHSTNAPVFLSETLETAAFITSAFDGSGTQFEATFSDIYSLKMFSDWFEQVFLPTLYLARLNSWVQPGTNNVLYLFGAYVRQLRVQNQTDEPFTCGCLAPSTFFPGATDQACYPPFDDACVDSASIDLGYVFDSSDYITTTTTTTLFGGNNSTLGAAATTALAANTVVGSTASDGNSTTTTTTTTTTTVALNSTTLPFVSAGDSGLISTQGYLDSYSGGGNFLTIDEAMIDQAATVCSASTTGVLMGAACADSSGSVFDYFLDNLRSNAPAVRFVEVGLEFRFLDDTAASVASVGATYFVKYNLILEISAINAMEGFTLTSSANLLASSAPIFFGVMSAILCAVWVLYTVWLGFVIRTMVLQWVVVERGHIVRIASCVLLDLLVASQSIFVFWYYAVRDGQTALQDALDMSIYYEFSYMLEWHRVSSILAVAAVILCACVLVSFLSFFETTKFVMAVISRATVRSVPALLLFLVFLVSWAVAGYAYYGAAVYSFSTAGQAFASAIFFLNGYIPFDEMNAVSHIYTLFMVVVALCVLNLVLFPMLTAIFVYCWVEGVEEQEETVQVDARGNIVLRDGSFGGGTSRGAGSPGDRGNRRASSNRGFEGHRKDGAHSNDSADLNTRGGPSFTCNQYWRSVWLSLGRCCNFQRKALKDSEWLRLYRKWRAYRTNDQRMYLTLEDLINMTELFGQKRPREAITLWSELRELQTDQMARTRQMFGTSDQDSAGINTGRGSVDSGLSYRRLGALKKLQQQVTDLYLDQTHSASLLKQLLHQNGRSYANLAKRVEALAQNFPDEKLDEL